MKQKKLVFHAHAGQRLKERNIPRDVVRWIAMYGQPVRTERVANWVTTVRRGECNGKPLHVVVKGDFIWTAYYANQWDCSVKVKRHPGVNVV